MAFEAGVMPFTRDVDLLHYTADTGPLLRGSKPIVSTIHGIASRSVSGVRTPVKETSWRVRVKAAIRASRHVITVSRSSKSDLCEEFGLPASFVSVIPHGVDPKFRPRTRGDSGDRDALTRFGFPERYVLYLGNLDPRKNVAELIRASDAFYDRWGIPLVVAGSSAWGSAETVQLLERSQSSIYVGRLDEGLLVEALRGAEVFCFPSLYEGFGLPVLEAMACGTPVVCSRRGSLEEVASGAALLLDDISAEGISEGVGRVLSSADLRLELSQRGLERASEYSWGVSIDAHGDVFGRFS